MTTATNAHEETLGFQTEVKQLLHLVTHSLYSNKEIFLRELISNASDALDKLRYEALNQNDLYEQDPDLAIDIHFDEKAHTITIRDNGIGMNREEIIDNLGTIAKSGTRAFLEKMTQQQKSKDAQLIGQFGVGFYSSFVVADKVTVRSRRAGLAAKHGVEWHSKGEGEFTVKDIKMANRGTEIILHLKKDEHEFLSAYRLRNIITKYSDHIAFPIYMPKEAKKSDGEDKDAPAEVAERERVNRATALWLLPKDNITDEQYKEFYKAVSHNFDDPLLWLHNRVEGKQQYISLLFIPSQPGFDLWQRDVRYGLKLYVQRVFIMDEADQLLPRYLRFVKGIIDSSDLPLNVSRELLQSNKQIDSIRTATTMRVLKALEKLAADDDEKYAKFWTAFGRALKEGTGEDFENKEKIAHLLRFASTETNTAAQTVSLDQYISRMKPGQEKIYYLTADSFIAAQNSPHLEIFRKKGIEVLLLSDQVDEWLVAHVTEYAGKKWQSVAKGDLDLGGMEDEATKEEQKQAEEQFTSLVEQMKKVLVDVVKDVHITHRLTDSPACVVAAQDEMSAHMQRMFQAMGQEMPAIKPILEINPKHPLVLRLHAEHDEQQFAELSHLLLDQAILAEGGQLKDPAQFVKRMNKLLLKD